MDVEGEGEGRRPPLQLIGWVLLVALVGLLSWFIVRRIVNGDSDAASSTAVAPAASAETTTAADDTAESSESSSTEDTVGSNSSTSDAATTTDSPTTTADSTTTSAPETTEAATTTTTSSPPTRPTGGYDTLPDGTPVPIVATFDGARVTLSGAVPDQASAARLEELARANSREPNPTVVNNLTINPNVPISVPVRVLELQSVRFPEGSATVELLHAAELNRVATVMNALPNVTVVVVGHADQQGESGPNQVLSKERADAVVDYLTTFGGINPSRLSARGVGEDDLLSINDDESALALNRRTEFIFSGLLVD